MLKDKKPFYLTIGITLCWIFGNPIMHHVPFGDRLLPYWNHLLPLGFFLINTYLLVKLRGALEHEKKLARTDFLTSIPNRRSFFEMAEAEIQRSLRYNRPFIVAYMDIDNFKSVNDRFGHPAGDALLKLASQTIKKSIRSVDFVARLGGDEFAILFPETGPHAAQGVIKKVQANLVSAMQKHQWFATFSIGTISYTYPPESVEEMIRKADAIMYAVKNSGKNTVRHEIQGRPEQVTAPR